LPKRGVSPWQNLSSSNSGSLQAATGAGPTTRAIQERLIKIPEPANKNGSIAHFHTGPSRVERTAPGAPFFTTPLKNSDAGNSIQTLSRTASYTTAALTKPGKHHSGSNSKETELKDESNFDDMTKTSAISSRHQARSINTAR
jgi:hypothetical protein